MADPKAVLEPVQYALSFGLGFATQLGRLFDPDDGRLLPWWRILARAALAGLASLGTIAYLADRIDVTPNLVILTGVAVGWVGGIFIGLLSGDIRLRFQRKDGEKSDGSLQ